MLTYGQFCPMAKALDVVGERWTLLIVRELLLGSCHFNDLRRGVPKMSPALLSARLRTLRRAGIVERVVREGRSCYTLTRSGHELKDVVLVLSAWGSTWAGELADSDRDLALLTRDIRRNLPIDNWPQSSTVVAVHMSKATRTGTWWWLKVADGHAEICDTDPGHHAAATVYTDLRTLTRIWRGDITWSWAMREGLTSVEAPAAVRRALPRWLGMTNTSRSTGPPRSDRGRPTAV
jgi:DNA-binding HxlR family transcriptional regulator